MNKNSNKRFIFAIVIIVLMFCILLARMFVLQVILGNDYCAMADKNRISFIDIQAQRGDILDRNGLVLAHDDTIFSIAVFNANNQALIRTVDRINQLVPRLRLVNTIILKKPNYRRMNMRILCNNLTWNELAIIEENAFVFHKDNAVENLSHTSSIPKVTNDDNVENEQNNSLKYRIANIIAIPEKVRICTDDIYVHFIGRLDNRVGILGIESLYNTTLAGQDGKKFVEINSTRSLVRWLNENETKRGVSIFSSLDSVVQQIIAKRLAPYDKAAVVMMSAETGEILAMYSQPCIANNDNNNSYMFNRATSGLYSPGSLVKMAIALAALKYRIIDVNTTFTCEGHINVGRERFHCWKEHGHGHVNVIEAIAGSCDVFFYTLGQLLGTKKLSEFFHCLGFDLEIDTVYGVKKTLMPDVNGRLGVAILASIGHGRFLITPLHMAVMMCRLITNKQIMPTCLKVDNAIQYDDLNIDEFHLQIVGRGLDAAFNSDIGTSRGYKEILKDVKMIGKTSTSQVKRVVRFEENGKMVKLKTHELPIEDRDHAMCVCSFEWHSKKYVIAIVLEHGGWGTSAAKVAARIVKDTVTEWNLADKLRSTKNKAVAMQVVPQTASVKNIEPNDSIVDQEDSSMTTEELSD
jgi:penicillin-binding protein 2